MNPVKLNPFVQMFVIASQVTPFVVHLVAESDANLPILWHCLIWRTFVLANASSNRRLPEVYSSRENHPNSLLSAHNASL